VVYCRAENRLVIKKITIKLNNKIRIIMETNLFETAQTFRFEAKVDYSEGGIVSKRVIDRPTGNVSLFAFDKGQRLSEHKAPFDAMVQVVEGQAEIVIDGVPYKVRAGESIIMPANITHAVNAVEKFKMVLTMIKG
jgi:quercetin dioxygenase-like cupin family protein